MKRALGLALLVLAICVFPACADERILSMDVTAVVQPNGFLVVRENIRFQAAGREIRRGLIRSIPTDYPDRAGKKHRTGFQLIGAHLNGNRTAADVFREGRNIAVRIGDPNRPLAHGVHTISLEYRTSGWIRFGKEFDELYLNALGEEWALPVDSVSFRIALPQGAEILRQEAFSGRRGSRGGSYERDADGAIRSVGTLYPGEAFTVATAWPKGFVRKPRQSLGSTLLAHRGPVTFLLVSLVFAYYALVWYFYGKDPKRIVVPLFRPPKGMTPGFARFLLHNAKYSGECLTADILNLAVKGFLHFREDGREIRLAPTPQVRADRKSSNGLPVPLWELADNLFSGLHDPAGVLVTEANADVLRKANEALKARYEMDAAGHIDRNTAFSLIGILFFAPLLLYLAAASRDSFSTATLALAINAIFFVLPLLAGKLTHAVGGGKAGTGRMLVIVSLLIIAGIGCLTGLDPIVTAGVVVAGAIAFFFSGIMSVPTGKGGKVLAEIEGLKMYMGTAERHRLAVLNPPDETPQHFEELLPYAFALDCAQTWADRFSGILAKAAYKPEWNEMRDADYLFSGHYYLRLSDQLSRAVAQHSAPPPPSSGDGGESLLGGSGFGGGGFSGGGMGGGGGRGW